LTDWAKTLVYRHFNHAASVMRIFWKRFTATWHRIRRMAGFILKQQFIQHARR
jgi:hypothetical protein